MIANALLEKFSPHALSPGSVLLDSISPEGDCARYSLMAIDPFLVFQGKGETIRISTAKGEENFSGDPLQFFEKLLRQYRVPENSSAFGPGAIGYLSYELGYRLQNLPCSPVDDLKLPDIWFAFYDKIQIYDHQEEKLLQFSMEEQEKIPADFFLKKDREQTDFPPFSFTKEEYSQAFRRSMEHIAAGDIYQINLCQRFSWPFPDDPWQTYRRLRKIHPTPLSAFLNTGRNFILSASPELFLKKEKDRIETCPIKGTRSLSEPRAKEDLLKSAKDRAEHIMIVDLERNDLGRICETGSIFPEKLLRVEGCGNVVHLVSTVRGKIEKNLGISGILQATFPGGSITGAPKHSAMKVISGLEPFVRGVYTGALGWIGFSGDFIFNLPIRTVLIQDRFAHFYVGGGIVADSTANGEYQEILDKGKAFFEILGIHGTELLSV